MWKSNPQRSLKTRILLILQREKTDRRDKREGLGTIWYKIRAVFRTKYGAIGENKEAVRGYARICHGSVAARRLEIVDRSPLLC